MKKAKKNPHIGTALDNFLKEDGTYDEITALVTEEKAEWQRGTGGAAEGGKLIPAART
ncbi:MAG TPA: hypothetical protein VLW75_09375 [Rhizomicrobium sp.]|nr:hypothetical protein [Rhizomicrobium sp.]